MQVIFQSESPDGEKQLLRAATDRHLTNQTSRNLGQAMLGSVCEVLHLLVSWKNKAWTLKVTHL